MPLNRMFENFFNEKDERGLCEFWSKGADPRSPSFVSFYIFPVKGEAYSFVVRLRPLAGKDKRSQEFTWAKRLAAVEGDTIEITKDGKFLVNGTVVRDSLPLAAKLGKEPEYFSRRQVLKKGELYFLGDTETSYDSRYWGPVKVTQLRGKVIGGVF